MDIWLRVPKTIILIRLLKSKRPRIWPSRLFSLGSINEPHVIGIPQCFDGSREFGSKWVSLASQNCGCAKILLSLTDRNGRTPVAVRHVSTIQINYYKSVEHILDRRISAQLLWGNTLLQLLEPWPAGSHGYLGNGASYADTWCHVTTLDPMV